MRRLRESYADDARAAAIADALAADRPLTVGACQGGLLPVVLAAALVRHGRAALVVAGDPQALVGDLEELGVRVALLPELDSFAEAEGAQDAPTGDRTGHTRRLAALEAFNAGSVLVASPLACEQPVPDLREVAASSIVVKPGEMRDIAGLIDQLSSHGYTVVPVVEARGQVAVRGGLIDVYPFIGTDAIRIELFGDQVDTIRRFEVESQESISRLDEAVLAAGGGLLATRRLFDQLPPGPIVVCGDTALRGRLKHDHGRHEVRLARILDGGALDGAGLGIDRLRGDARRGLAELARILAEAEAVQPADAGLRGALLLARNEESVRELNGHLGDAGLAATVAVGRLSAGFRDVERGLVVVHDFELAERAPVRRRVGTRVSGGAPLSSLTDLKHGDFVVHLQHGVGRFRGLATLEKRGFMEDFLLLEFAGGTKLYVPVEAIDLVQKYVSATGKAPELSTIGGAAWQKKRARAEKAIADMSADLLRNQVARLATAAPAMGSDSAAVRRFDASFPFEETEDQLAAVREIRSDLARAHAMDRLLCGDVGFGKTEVAIRAAMTAVDSGHQVAILAPTTLLAEQHFETFKERFAETGAVVAGLDRFRSGKERTATLAAAAAGKVDVIIGTHAILTEKLTFPRLGLVVIDEEHRFGVKQKERLRAFIGAPGPAPAGVEGQEPSPIAPAVHAPKAARQAPHVLTLSATPIPRTLHFSLLGIRDISVLAEAPAERMAVETRVAIWDDQTVRHALQREKERGGQCFVVHNRVADLDQLAYKFSKLVPGLRLDTLHGQMDEDRVARVMDEFRHGKLDVLVSTSIVESGIDVPNANTLFVNNAHFFGLAELHQLRGRIGRFTKQAYAYFMVPSGGEIGQDARERLDAIQEYAELGAGFKLAMRDLELRGAGNLLGAEQSGHIDAIGYELYTKLLGEAVDKAKAAAAALHGATPGPASPATAASTAAPAEQAVFTMPVDAYIPDDWLEAPALKFELHKHLDGARRMSDLQSVARRARDRFGSLPPPVVRLFQVRAIRMAARALGITRIDVADRQFRLRLAGALPQQLAAMKVPELIHVQLDAGQRAKDGTAAQQVLVLFMRPQLTQDAALPLLCRLFAIDTAWLA
jgi:transcription-repair coupling factor (superfamily II helicase)